MSELFRFKPDVVLTNEKGNREIILPPSQNRKGIFCQHYLYFSKFDIPSTHGPQACKEMHDFATRKFVLPEGMSQQDAFKVLSFLTKYVEQQYGLEECSSTTVQCVDKLIEKFYFKHIEPEGESPFRFVRANCEPCTHLFTVNGNTRYFNHSQYAKHYFEWFTDDVKYEEVKGIYTKLGLETPEIALNSKSEREL